MTAYKLVASPTIHPRASIVKQVRSGLGPTAYGLLFELKCRRYLISKGDKNNIKPLGRYVWEGITPREMKVVLGVAISAAFSKEKEVLGSVLSRHVVDAKMTRDLVLKMIDRFGGLGIESIPKEVFSGFSFDDQSKMFQRAVNSQVLAVTSLPKFDKLIEAKTLRFLLKKRSERPEDFSVSLRDPTCIVIVDRYKYSVRVQMTL